MRVPKVRIRHDSQTKMSRTAQKAIGKWLVCIREIVFSDRAERTHARPTLDAAEKSRTRAHKETMKWRFRSSFSRSLIKMMSYSIKSN